MPFDGAALADAVRNRQRKDRAMGIFPRARRFRAFAARPAHVRLDFLIRDQPGENDHALRCHDEVLALLAAQGLCPFRLGMWSMHVAQQGQ